MKMGGASGSLPDECLEIAALARYACGDAKSKERESLEVHLIQCHTCRLTVVLTFESFDHPPDDRANKMRKQAE